MKLTQTELEQNLHGGSAQFTFSWVMPHKRYLKYNETWKMEGSKFYKTMPAL